MCYRIRVIKLYTNEIWKHDWGLYVQLGDWVELVGQPGSFRINWGGVKKEVSVNYFILYVLKFLLVALQG